MEFISKQIFSDIDDVSSVGDATDRYNNSQLLEWSFLRKECDNLELDKFYKTYMLRLQRSFLSIYFVLQTVISISHVVILATTSFGESEPADYFFYTFSILIIWIVLFPAFKEELVKEKRWLPYACSIAATIVLLFSDIGVTIYHDVNTNPDPPLRPMYASHLLLIIYMFLPIMKNWVVMLMGASVTICYIAIYSTISFKHDTDKAHKIFSEIFFLTCMNFIGIHFRIMSEIDIRRTFLDRRECVQENLHLKFERNQEKALLLSILPVHIAEKMENDLQHMIKKVKLERRRTTYHILNPSSLGVLCDAPKPNQHMNFTNKLYVETHENVSILYADVVNFTHMTTQLSVRTLVETLHELFVKFDEASEEFNVLRIKFLGDCYYGVSGLPVKNKNHAKNCVELGLRMISEIAKIRNSRSLNIDMRIGVHSGTVIGGVMGALKWQYDVWSKDVVIANKLESTGVAGQVHISKQTLDLIGRNYNIKPGTEQAKVEKFLVKNNIETFLISPNSMSESQLSVEPEDGHCRHSISYARRNFMHNSMQAFQEIMQQTNMEMENELKKMPIGKFRFNKLFIPRVSREDQRSPERYSLENDENYVSPRRASRLSPLLLCFSNKKLEWDFLQEPDILLKYSVLMGFIVLVTIILIQVLNRSTGELFYWVISFSAAILFSIIPLVWFKKIWDMYMLKFSEEDSTIPKFKPLRVMYKISYQITKNAILRTFIYLVVVTVLVLCSLVHLVECSNEYSKVNGTLWNDHIKHDANYFSICLNSWSVTQSLVLVICASFLFLRIHFLLKLTVATLVNILYFYVIFFWVNHIYDVSQSTNITLDSKIAHFLKIVVTTVIFHMVDRQTEYIQRIDFNWKQQLEAKKEEAEITRVTNKILVHNILPVHVAEIYLGRQLRNEFYNEEYENVAVCFATITNFDCSMANPKHVLEMLNEVICDFDETLVHFTGYQKIEKIKVIGWTYMVACGLDPTRSDSSSSNYGLQYGRRSFNTSIYTNSLNRRFRKEQKLSVRQSNNVVVTLTEFSLELMRTLRKFSRKKLLNRDPLNLRVGISYGSVMAGVVGSSKPLYDIWGNAVNMASRMDSTNIPGNIQVTEESANILTSFGYVCDFRGKTHIKGRGLIPTYFVSINDELNFAKKRDVTERNSYFCADL